MRANCKGQEAAQLLKEEKQVRPTAPAGSLAHRRWGSYSGKKAPLALVLAELADSEAAWTRMQFRLLGSMGLWPSSKVSWSTLR